MILSLESDDGQLSDVDAEGETYEKDKAATEASIPEGSKAVAIRIE